MTGTELVPAAIEEPRASPYQLMYGAYMSRVRKIDKDLSLNSQLAKQPHVSTGLLCVDMLLGNGFVPGFNVFLGEEQSAKSTACMTTLGASLKINVPLRKYFDAEGAIDMKYTGNILGVDAFEDVFGQQDRMGRWVNPPRCIYHDTNIMDDVFRDIHRITQFLPDKVYRDDVGEWFPKFGRSHAEIALIKDMKLTADKTLFRSTGQYWCSVGDDDSPQAMIFIDSLPALIPKAIDEEEMSDNARAIDARFLGKFLKLVRGKLRPKAAILMAVNQLRSNPAPGPGKMDYYEPGGNILKFASDTRTMWASRVPQDGFPRFNDNKGLCEENSVEFSGGKDLYAFKAVTNIKNKYGQPKRKTFARVWIKDGQGEPRGFDPVYDTYKFLDQLGLIQGAVHDKRKPFRIAIPKIASVEWTWPLFKAFIIAQEDGRTDMLRRCYDKGAPKFKLREYCFHMIRTGMSEDLLAKEARKGNTKLLPSSANIEVEPEEEEGDE